MREPNDEPLWEAVRASADGFLRELWRSGALMGAQPRDAWFVQCGRHTTADAEVQQGLVNLMVGFAPIRPGDFLTFRLALQAAPRPAEH